tara:strand:+ start:117 stop:305 length:189 start_codon:yes stop_codon:yes gene_type:complete
VEKQTVLQTHQVHKLHKKLVKQVVQEVVPAAVAENQAEQEILLQFHHHKVMPEVPVQLHQQV